ncbi:hypothetical protein KR009_011084 [Drosophila setifemur]|nr:hypothetical protein KR009_011084 [Drosophila setifemur]
MDIPGVLTKLAILLALLKGVTPESSHLRFLNKLFERIQHKENALTLFMLQHNQSTNCSIKDWNPPGTPILRYNQLAKINIRKHFNHRSICVVCICKDSEMELIDNLAESLFRMRQERIILWIQAKVTQEMIEFVSKRADRHQFLQILILGIGADSEEPEIILRMEAHPIPHFHRIENVFVDIKHIYHSIFLPHGIDFKGRIANILPDWKAGGVIHKRITPHFAFPLIRIQDNEFIEFALKYNLMLRILNDSDANSSVSPDVEFNTRMNSDRTYINNLNPYDKSSLMVVVPCGKEKTIAEVFKQLDVRSLLLYLLPVYVTFVAVETIILVVTYRICGQTYRMTYLNPLLNLRAFRAILGLPFPTCLPATLSLRQLFLAISIFGLVFSNFFSCKLSALLTKHSVHPQVLNLDDLRESDLNIVVSPSVRSHIESELGPDYFERYLPRLLYMNESDRIIQMYSLNDSNAVVTFSENWNVFQTFQNSIGQRVMCNAKNLTIIDGLPMRYKMRNNSLLDQPLSIFLIRIKESGLMGNWLARSPFLIKSTLNLKNYIAPIQTYPLTFNDFTWLWCILGSGYLLAIVAFIAEVALGWGKVKVSRSEQQASVV